MRKYSRREWIAAAGFTAIGGLAGCSSMPVDSVDSDSSTSTDGSDGRTGSTASGRPAYQRWLPAPRTFGDQTHYTFRYRNYTDILEAENELDTDVFDRETFDFDQLGIDINSVDETVRHEPVTDLYGSYPSVVLGNFDRGNVTALADEMNMGRSEDIGEYTVRVGDSVLAVKDGALILADEVPQLETLIESNNGDGTRYTGENDDMNELLSYLGSGTFINGGTFERVTETELEGARIEGQVGFGFVDRVDGEVTEATIVFLFDSPSAVDTDAIGDYTEQSFFENFSEISSSSDGRAAIITGRTDTADLYDW